MKLCSLSQNWRKMRKHIFFTFIFLVSIYYLFLFYFVMEPYAYYRDPILFWCMPICWIKIINLIENYEKIKRKPFFFSLNLKTNYIEIVHFILHNLHFHNFFLWVVFLCLNLCMQFLLDMLIKILPMKQTWLTWYLNFDYDSLYYIFTLIFVCLWHLKCYKIEPM
jgi:hypothetical protein